MHNNEWTLWQFQGEGREERRMTRLIDADALYTLFVKMKSFGELTAKKAIRCVEEAPTVDAIPIEWIENYLRNYRYIAPIEKSFVRKMIKAWAERKEE